MNDLIAEDIRGTIKDAFVIETVNFINNISSEKESIRAQEHHLRGNRVLLFCLRKHALPVMSPTSVAHVHGTTEQDLNCNVYSYIEKSHDKRNEGNAKGKKPCID